MLLVGGEKTDLLKHKFSTCIHKQAPPTKSLGNKDTGLTIVRILRVF